MDLGHGFKSTVFFQALASASLHLNEVQTKDLEVSLSKSMPQQVLSYQEAGALCELIPKEELLHS